MMWSNFFLEGGFGMYPTTIVGILLVAAAVVNLLQVKRHMARLLRSLGLLTLVSGALGSGTGIINTFHYLQRVAPAEQFKLAALGCAESLNNMVLALLFLGLTLLMVCIGSLRAVRRESVG